jgi:hypothetical protein
MTERDNQVERALGRTVALGLPAASVLGAVAVGTVASVGSGLLVLAAGALLGAIGLLWASVRTLSGDAPLSTDFEMLGEDSPGVDALVEDKRRILRALKDLESEHALGKLNDADYSAIVSSYRADAKGVMRQMDARVAPFRGEAERLAQSHLKKRGLGSMTGPRAPDAVAPSADRRLCGTCKTSNERDAAFCKKCGAQMEKEPGGGQA